MNRSNSSFWEQVTTLLREPIISDDKVDSMIKKKLGNYGWEYGWFNQQEMYFALTANGDRNKYIELSKLTQNLPRKINNISILVGLPPKKDFKGTIEIFLQGDFVAIDSSNWTCKYHGDEIMIYDESNLLSKFNPKYAETVAYIILTSFHGEKLVMDSISKCKITNSLFHGVSINEIKL